MTAHDTTSTLNPMLPHVHHHLDQELRQVARTDTVFVVVAAFFNLIVLGINSAVAGIAAGDDPGPSVLIFAILVLSTVAISAMSLRALQSSRATRTLLMDGLQAMYRDVGVAKYYPTTVTRNVAARYTVFSVIIAILGGLAVVIPLIQLLF